MTIAIQINTNNMGREKEGTDSGLPYGGGLACGLLYGQLLGNQRSDFMASLMGGGGGRTSVTAGPAVAMETTDVEGNM